MYQNIVLSCFVLLVVMIGVDLVADLFSINFTYYLLSLFILGLGIVSYPLDFKFRSKIDLIFLAILVTALVNLMNLLYFKNFSFEIYCINVVAGVFGIVLSLFKIKIEF
jgi:hypothetical protein